MKAFHGKPEIKAEYLARVRAHRKADQLVKGYYWKNGKGCAVGCTVHSSSHAAYETELGIPQKLARLEDGIFEGLPNGKALLWPEQFLRAIVVGADLSQVADKFLYWLLVDKKDGVIRFAKTDVQRTAIADVGELYRRKIASENITTKHWQAARNAAAAAYAAAAAAAAYAAAAAAYDAAAAAYDAAAAAYDAAAYAAYVARTNARIRQAQKLLALLRSAPNQKEQKA